MPNDMSTAHSPRARQLFSTPEFLQSVFRALLYYPYYVVLTDLDLSDDAEPLLALVENLERVSGATPQDEPVSFTEVRVAPDEAAEGGAVTRFSRTHEALAAHTDSSYAERPHELVAFHCVRADAEGGETIMTPVDDILRALPNRFAEILRRPIFPFAENDAPILARAGGVETVRYYRRQLDLSAEQRGARFDAETLAALDALDRVLAQFAERPGPHRFALAPGEILLMNNLRALHARTGFKATSDRLIFRVRRRIETLNPDRFAEPAPAPAAAPAPTGAAPSEETAEAALGAGRFDEARALYGRIHAARPGAYEPGLAYAALLRDDGRVAEAERVERAVLERNAFGWSGARKPNRPTVLWTRGFATCRYGVVLGGDDAYTTVLRDGHFSLTHLFDDREQNVAVASVFEDNIERAEAPEIDLVLNAIADPDREAASLRSLTRFLAARPGTPVINPPQKVLGTTRDRIALRLGAIPGVRVARTERVRFEDPRVEARRDLLAGLGFAPPLILRRTGTQTGQSAKALFDERALFAALETAKPDTEHYVAEFLDVRRKDGLYPKSRVFFVDGRLHPVANLVHDDWSVHSGDRYAVMAEAPWAQEAERAYLADFAGAVGAETVNRLHAIAREIDLDFFGIDFTVKDGALIVFEANAAMRHNFDHADAFPYTRPSLEAVTASFRRMVAARIGDR